MTRRRHTPEQVIRKLREADRMLAEGGVTPVVRSGACESPTGNFDFYLDVGFWLIPSRLRLTRWLRPTPGDAAPSDLEDIEQSIHARVVDLLKARDGVAFNWLRHQNNATLDDMLYHLRAAIPTATALFDSLATFACNAFEVDC